MYLNATDLSEPKKRENKLAIVWQSKYCSKSTIWYSFPSTSLRGEVVSKSDPHFFGRSKLTSSLLNRSAPNLVHINFILWKNKIRVLICQFSLFFEFYCDNPLDPPYFNMVHPRCENLIFSCRWAVHYQVLLFLCGKRAKLEEETLNFSKLQK